ncbi:MAG: acyltransferase family protein [Lachnospirales bacterium]
MDNYKNIIDTDINRNEIQIMRFVAIVLVIIHHSINNLSDNFWGNLILNIACADVTVFFCISGYLFEKNIERYSQDKTKFLIKKLKQLIVPYIFWSLLLYIGVNSVHLLCGVKISNAVTKIGFMPLSFLEIVKCILTCSNIYVDYLWFIYILFVFFVVNIFIGKKYNNAYVLIFFVVLSVVCNYFGDLPHIIWKFLLHLPDFIMGRIMYKIMCKHSLREYKNKVLSVFFILFVVLFIIISFLLPNLGSSFGVTLFGTFIKKSFYWIIVVICGALATSIREGKIMNYMVNVGDYSYDIYLIHMPYVVPIAARGLGVFNMPYVLKFLIVIIIGIMVPLFISKYIVRKISLFRKIAIGKFD